MEETSDVLERFLRYCEVSSQSDPLSEAGVPSTPAQHEMARVLGEDMRELGAEDVVVDEHAYVVAHWPASAGCEDLPCLGLCAHLDTAWQTRGENVHPHVVRYEGGRLVMGVVDGEEVFCDETTNPELAGMAGTDIVVSDGTTLIGGDDKAGVAEVVSLLARLKADPAIPHPRLAVAFVPDEEIGHGAALLDLDAFGARWGYTLDAGPLGEFAYECFNAAEACVRARGVSVHTGTAKGIMVNASEAIMRFHRLLPAAERPEYTEGYDGFFYLERMSGDCERASADYIIRDHDAATFERRKRDVRRAVAFVNEDLGGEYLTVEIHDQYRNMADVIRDGNMHLVANCRAAFEACGHEMRVVPMRGGTDGAQLCYRGLPCPNISAGYYNAHGVREFVPVAELEGMVDVLQELVGRYARPQEGLA